MLRLEHVCKGYGGRTVIRDLSLAIAPGTLTLVAGANGAGKSTLLRVLAGLAAPDAGVLSLAPPPGATGCLGHETQLYPNLTALENLAFWQKLHKKPADEQTLFAALEDMGLAAIADERTGALSRGTLQRLSLTRLFLQQPRLLLLDEPLSGLDAPSAAHVRTRLVAFRDAGSALVWVTHEPLQEAAVADAALLLFPGGRHRLLAPEEFAAMDGLLAAGAPSSGILTAGTLTSGTLTAGVPPC